MQTAGVFVITVRELTAGVKLGKNQLDTANALGLVNIDRHPAPVVFHFNRAVFAQGESQRFRMSCERLVDAIVDYLLHEVVGARGIGIHAGSLTYGVEPGQNFNSVGVVGVAHAVVSAILNGACKGAC